MAHRETPRGIGGRGGFERSKDERLAGDGVKELRVMITVFETVAVAGGEDESLLNRRG